MFRGLTRVVRKLYGDEPLSLEEWAEQSAKLSSPDDLIAASVIQSFAKDFAKWVPFGDFDCTFNRGELEKRRTIEASLKLSNPDTGTKVILTIKKQGTRSWYCDPWRVSEESFECSVNGTQIEDLPGRRIRSAWGRLSSDHEAAQEAAARAKADMEANERKWNLAEKLLGMKRNEFGALVPVETAS